LNSKSEEEGSEDPDASKRSLEEEEEEFGVQYAWETYEKPKKTWPPGRRTPLRY